MMDKLYGTNIDFDSLWTKFDFDSNGFLDLKEAMYFLDEVQTQVKKAGAGHYFSAGRNYTPLFQQFNKGINGLFNKKEMANLIKSGYRIQIEESLNGEDEEA